MFFEKNLNFYFHSKPTKNLVAKLQELLALCYENLNYAKKS